MEDRQQQQFLQETLAASGAGAGAGPPQPGQGDRGQDGTGPAGATPRPPRCLGGAGGCGCLAGVCGGGWRPAKRRPVGSGGREASASGTVGPGLPQILLLPVQRRRAAAGAADPEVGAPCEVNHASGVPIDVDGFRGKLLIIHRPDPEPKAWPYRDHFAERKRNFELRLQGVFTEPPGEVFFAAEITRDVGFSYLGAITANSGLAFVSALNAALGTGLHVATNVSLQADGSTEHPHMAWPLLQADAVVATPRGEAPPVLSETIKDTGRASRGIKTLDTAHVYTFVFHSKYVNFSAWEACNIMGMSRSIDHFIGQQPLLFSIYRLLRSAPDGSHVGLHAESNKKYFVRGVVTGASMQFPPEIVACGSEKPPSAAESATAAEATAAAAAAGSPKGQTWRSYLTPWAKQRAE